MNAVEIEEAVSELAASPFDAAEFPFAFLLAFGNKDTTVNRLRKGETNKSDVENGVLQRSNIHIAITKTGQTGEALRRLRDSPQTARQKAKFILATDGVQVEAEDLKSGEPLTCPYTELGNHFGFFLPLAGISTVREVKDNPIDIKATGRLNKLYVQLLKENQDWGTPERRHDLNRFMARMIFCFFAEDTGIFNGDNLFTTTLRQMTEADGSNTRDVLQELFRVMNVRAPDGGSRPGFPSWADRFPYVNGGLFEDDIGCPKFSRTSRAYLLRAGELDWKSINPDIFGSMIQAVADDDERGELGMHYTSVPNIQKVLDPLFLDDLREQLEAAGTNKRKLHNLRQRLSRIRVFDPACGSGNFLVIAYIRMREIEDEITRRRGEALIRSEISLTQFYGIEIKSFAAEIARLSLLIAEFQCDVRFIGQAEARALVLPLHATGNIVTDNALRIDWEEVCPPAKAPVEEQDLGGPTGRLALEDGDEAWETYICGNPPYMGTKYQTREHKVDLAVVFGNVAKKVGNADYVLGWLHKAATIPEQMSVGGAAFVTTNSLFEGEQAEILHWILSQNIQEIFFAHTGFRWSNHASNNAGVTVCIVGFCHARHGRQKKIYGGGEVRKVPFIGPYLVVTPEGVVVTKSSRPISGLPQMVYGSMSNDDGHLTISEGRYFRLLSDAPTCADLVKIAVGGAEFIKGITRRSVYVPEGYVLSAEQKSEFSDIFEKVEEYRLESKRDATKRLASIPHLFAERRHGEGRRIFIPQILSEKRPYITGGYLEENRLVIAPHMQIPGDELYAFAVLSSRLHHVWVSTVCGKLETRLRYSNTLGWNTFPVPNLTEQNKADLTRCAEDILLARETHFPATIAELYDPEKMPADLRAAHDRNDETLERIYIGRRFRNDTERLEKLFDMYTKMTAKKEGTAA